MKQIKLIDKSKKQDLTSEPNKDIISDLKRLQLYAKNYLSKMHNISSDDDSDSNITINESGNGENAVEDESQSLAQAEVESLMPSVSLMPSSSVILP